MGTLVKVSICDEFHTCGKVYSTTVTVGVINSASSNVEVTTYPIMFNVLPTNEDIHPTHRQRAILDKLFK